MYSSAEPTPSGRDNFPYFFYIIASPRSLDHNRIGNHVLTSNSFFQI